MQFNNNKFLIGGIYRVPNTDIELFSHEFNRLIEPLKSSYKLILLGDYNVDLLKNDNTKTKFELCMQANYLMPTILKATRVSLSTNSDGLDIKSETLLDNIFINQNIKSMSGIINSSISDHYPVYIILPDVQMQKSKLYSFKYRLINNQKQRTFNSYLNHYKINDILNDYIAESAYNKFFSIFQKAYDKSFPLMIKYKTHKDLLHPWITESHLSDMRERDKLCKLANKQKINKNIYTEFRNNLKNS